VLISALTSLFFLLKETLSNRLALCCTINARHHPRIRLYLAHHCGNRNVPDITVRAMVQDKFANIQSELSYQIPAIVIIWLWL
jgi:hypothetical protein